MATKSQLHVPVFLECPAGERQDLRDATEVGLNIPIEKAPHANMEVAMKLEYARAWRLRALKTLLRELGGALHGPITVGDLRPELMSQ